MIGEGVAVLIRRQVREHDVTPGSQRLEELVERFRDLRGGRDGLDPPVSRRARGPEVPQRCRAAAGDLFANKPESITRQVLAGLDIAGYFDVVIGGDTLPRNKPDPLPLRTALENLRLRPSVR